MVSILITIPSTTPDTEAPSPNEVVSADLTITREPVENSTNIVLNVGGVDYTLSSEDFKAAARYLDLTLTSV